MEIERGECLRQLEAGTLGPKGRDCARALDARPKMTLATFVTRPSACM